jgi:hypothetical protein
MAHGGGSPSIATNDPYIAVRWDGREYERNGDATWERGLRVARGVGEEQDGPFCRWSWDGDSLRVESDWSGLQPLFYYARDNRIVVSSSLQTLLRQGVAKDLDYAALGSFLQLGFYLADTTPFAHVRAVPPNARILWRQGRLEVTGGYRTSTPLHLDRSQAVDGMIELTRQAIRRRLPAAPSYWVPLSGGRDSRHVLLELSRQRQGAKCITAAMPSRAGANEVRVAAELAQRLGLSHQIVAASTHEVDAELAKNRLTNFCADEHRWYLALTPTLEGEPGDVYDGLAGDVLSDILGAGDATPAHSELYEQGRFADLAATITPNLGWALDKLVVPDVMRRFRQAPAGELLTNELARHRHAQNPIASFYFWNRTRREVALIPYALLANGPRVHCPFVDRDLYDLLTGLPWRSVADNNLHTEAIHRAYPEFADVPFSDALKSDSDGERPMYCSPHPRRYAQDLLGYFLTKRAGRGTLVKQGAALQLLSLCTVHGASADDYVWFFNRLLYLLQLESLLAEA